MAREAEIRSRLDEVLDPELDQSVVAMGFIEELHEDAGAVRIAFRLPTHWCGANFAFLMALDMRDAVEALPWVHAVEVRLLDHFAAGRINRTIAARGPFADAFPDEPAGDLASLRRAFGEKALLSRQETLLRLLVAEQGFSALTLPMSGLALLARGESERAHAARRYLSARRQWGGPTHDDDVAFTDLAGVALTEDRYAEHMRAARRVRGAATANAEHCRLLMQGRRAAPAPQDRTSPAGIYE